MERLGYKCSVLKINAAEYGIPQKRKRVFFLASKKEIKAELKQTHGSDKECAANPELLPYERVVDWIGKFDDQFILVTKSFLLKASGNMNLHVFRSGKII